VVLLREHLGDAVFDLDGELAGAVVDRFGGAPRPDVAVQTGDDAVLVFSSGTTDLPKAVRHTHASIALATEHWVLALGLGHDDRFQVATPPSHILGLLNLLAAASAGATVRLHRRFELDAELRCIQEDRMTLEMAVAPIALAMANHPDLESFDLTSLRYVMWGATPVTPAVAEAVSARAGVRWLPAYGTSEVPVIAANPVADPSAWRLESAGLPVGDVELRVVDANDQDVPRDGHCIGEIIARSDGVMKGYWRQAEASAEALRGGWFHTGDMAVWDEQGYILIVDRKKDVIITGAETVSSLEVEKALLSHPAVLEVAVIPVPDEKWGEVPKALVVLKQNAQAGEIELIEHCRSCLAHYKCPRSVEFLETLPRTGTGKVRKRDLRNKYWQGDATRVAQNK